MTGNLLTSLACAALMLLFAALSHARSAHGQPSERPIVLALHGGAGTITRDTTAPELEAAYRAKLEEALRAGYAVLEEGGSSLDAVVTSIRLLEDSPLFNAGKGAVYTNAKTHELDASIMEGATRRAGAVAAVRHVKNPIVLARLVMERSPHVLLVGEGAESFAREQEVEMVPNDYFDTPRRLEQLRRAKAVEVEMGQNEDELPLPHLEGGDHPADRKFGTVGAVALDRVGNLAAGTSTGGTTNKRWGRVGDSPIIGAGTYADNETCAVSSTGHGEYFIRGVVAHEVAARMRYGGQTVQEAAEAVIGGTLAEMGGTGGVIALDRQGRVAMPFNTPGMFRGYIDAEGEIVVEIYR